jgi:hypothetical protein
MLALAVEVASFFEGRKKDTTKNATFLGNAQIKKD